MVEYVYLRGIYFESFVFNLGVLVGWLENIPPFLVGWFRGVQFTETYTEELLASGPMVACLILEIVRVTMQVIVKKYSPKLYSTVSLKFVIVTLAVECGNKERDTLKVERESVIHCLANKDLLRKS